jgi:hypothetical protein
MNPETGVYELLSTNTSLTALVGSKIYPVTAPENTATPYVVYSQLEEQETLTQDGPAPNGWVFQVTTVGKNNFDSSAVARLVKSALSWKTQLLDSGETIRTVFDDELNASFDDEQKYFQTVQEYKARKT